MINKNWIHHGVKDIDGLFAIFGTVFFGTIISFSFYMKGLSILGPTKTSLLAAVEPVASAFFIYLFLRAKVCIFRLYWFYNDIKLHDLAC